MKTARDATADRGKLTRLMIVLLVGLGANVATGLFVDRQGREAVVAAAFERLQLFHGLRRAALEDYFASMASDVRAASRNHRVVRAFREFSVAWAQIGPEAPAALRRLYIERNPYAAGERHELSHATDASSYSDRHAAFHGWARRFIEHFGYYDMFLIDRDGTILYSVAKEDDFGTNLKTGPYGESPLGFVYQFALKRGGKQIAFSDFERYAPSNNDPAAFAGSAIVAGDGSVLGVFAVQLPSDPINELLGLAAGLGETGEIYLVGSDELMRSQSRFADKSTLLEKAVRTDSVSQALAGFSGAHVIRNAASVPVLSVYAPVDFRGQRWVLLAEIAEAEVLKAVSHWLTLLAALGAGLAAAGLAFAALHLVRGPLRAD